MTDQAPVSSQHVRLKLHNLVNMPERVIEQMEITTTITKHDRAETTVRMPGNSRRDVWERWWSEILQVLRFHLEGADGAVPFAGVTQTFTVEWDGICRPI